MLMTSHLDHAELGVRSSFPLTWLVVLLPYIISEIEEPQIG